MILPIYLKPQPILRQKTQEINLEEIKSDKFQQLVKDMIDTMRHASGIGLAAPQIGLGKRLTIIDTKEVTNKEGYPEISDDVLILVNPHISKKSFKKNIMEEGCLSIPGIYGTVKRPDEITIKYSDIKGNKLKLKAGKLLARVIQHEVDHLEGILFTDKVLEYSNENMIEPDYTFIA